MRREVSWVANNETGSPRIVVILIVNLLDGYCSTVQGLLDWLEVDLGFTELSL